LGGRTARDGPRVDRLQPGPKRADNPFMVQYAVLLFSGLLFLYQLLILWGFSAGLVSPGPWYALVGGLLMFPIASATTLYFPRTAAGIAAAGGILALVWPVTGLAFGLGSPADAVLSAAVPVFVTAFGIRGTLRRRWLPNYQTRARAALTVLLAALPFVLFFTLFHGGAVAALFLHGPPAWPVTAANAGP
jgi:hypothetical protein